MFTQPSAPFLPVATNSAYDTSFFALAGGGGGSNLPAGADGDYLFNDGANWVAQSDPVKLGAGNDITTSCVGIGQNISMAGATNCFVVGNGVNFTNNPDSAVGLGDNIIVSQDNCIAIGSYANSAGNAGIAIGQNATVGTSPQGISIGVNAGQVNNSKDGTINIGQSAGNSGVGGNQGTDCINIGKNAGAVAPGSADNSITLNASGSNLSAVYSSLYVAPILASTMTNYLSYDPASKLVGYGAPSVAPSFNIISQSSTALNTFAGSNVDEFNIASGDLNSLLPSGHSYLITLKFSWDLIQNPADSNFTTALTSNTFINPQIVYGTSATPTSFSQIGLFTTNYVGSNSYFGGNVVGSFPQAYDNTLSGILNISALPNNAVYFVLQFAKATYTAPAVPVNINQYNFSAVQLT